VIQRPHRERLHIARVHGAVQSAVTRGELPPLAAVACECGAAAAAYHHDDYGRPLAVRALCNPCHRSWHKLHGGAPVPAAEAENRRDPTTWDAVAVERANRALAAGRS